MTPGFGELTCTLPHLSTSGVGIVHGDNAGPHHTTIPGMTPGTVGMDGVAIRPFTIRCGINPGVGTIFPTT